MKAFTVICALSLFIIGCASDRTQRDSFVSLHTLVKQTLGDRYDCGPITTNKVNGGRYFEVTPRPRSLSVIITEKQFFSQTEWDRRYAFATNQMSEFMQWGSTNYPIYTNRPIDAKTAEQFNGFTNAFGLLELPEWHYQNAGVNVKVQEVDVVYPGYEQDEAEAQKCYSQIVRLLASYHRPNGTWESLIWQ